MVTLLTYSNNVIITISLHIQLWHSQNSLFRHFQAYSMLFSNIQPCLGILRGIKTYWGIFRYYWGVWSHNQTYSELCLTFCIQPCHIQNLGLFRTPGISKSLSKLQDVHAYSEHWHSEKSLFMHFQGYLGIFRDIDAHSALFRSAKQEGRGETSPNLFQIDKSVLFWEKKALIVSIFGLNLSFKM